MRFYLFSLFLVIFFRANGKIDLDSAYSVRYNKSFKDSVFNVGDLIRCPEIWFDLNNGRLLYEHSEDSVKLISEFLMRNPFLVVDLIVHTDDRGNDSYNLSLSQHKSVAIKDYMLKTFGNDTLFSERIIAVGKGEKEIIFSSDFINNSNLTTSEEELLYQFNRRIELRIKHIMHPNFHIRKSASSLIQENGVYRMPELYEELVFLADKALLEGRLNDAVMLYRKAAQVAPANEVYAQEQMMKILELQQKN